MLGGYFSAKINGKNYHLYLNQGSSYIYQAGQLQTYVLEKEIPTASVHTYKISETPHRDKIIGIAKINDGGIESFELNQIKTKNIKLKKLILPIKHISLVKQTYNNEKCSFQFIDLDEVQNIYLFKEISYLTSEIMDSFREYECDYLKSSRSSSIIESLNQLTCESEIIFLKDRFYGVSFLCTARLAKADTFKYQVFSVIYDKSLKARAVRSDFTMADISYEDDSRNLQFRLTPVGLGLYSADALENKKEYLRIVPYIGLRKNFSVWGKPKRYLSHFTIK